MFNKRIGIFILIAMLAIVLVGAGCAKQEGAEKKEEAKVLSDVRVRKALALSIDRQAIIDNVTQAFQSPAYALVPEGVPDVKPGEDFRKVGGDYFQEDVDKALELLEEAGYPNGEGFPSIEILYNTSDNNKAIAEAIQEMWKSNLGIDVRLANQEWGVYLGALSANDYQIACVGWSADYVDAMTFMDMWVTDGGNNLTNWGNSEYDTLINEAKSNSNPEIRIKAMHDAEKILMDEMPIIPIYFYTNVNMYKPWVKDVVVPTIGGYQEFRWASVDKPEQNITYNLHTEPETLDTATARGAVEGTVQMAMFEGLTRLDKNNQPIPGMAESWEISDDGLKYTFKLRDAKWTNGDTVTAHDFEYAWKRLLSPDTAADYAYQLWYLKNGEKYTNGEVGADEVGVKAIDDKTLEVKLHSSTPYFLSLTAFPNLYPVNKNVVEQNPDWHAKVETLVGNGPFKITDWKHSQEIVLEKNENYWNVDDVKLEKISMVMVESQDTELTMFDTDQIDIAEETPTQETRRLLDESKATIYPDLSVYYYMVNVEK